MPIYEYKCDLCNGLWEEIQKFSDDLLTVCKSCEKEGGVHKLFSGGIAFHLKGGGWHKDGYSSKKDEGKAEIVTEDKKEIPKILPPSRGVRHEARDPNGVLHQLDPL